MNLDPAVATGILAILAALLSVANVVYGIAQTFQKADASYVNSLLQRVTDDERRISVLELSLINAGIDREKLNRDLLAMTQLLMDAQQQLAETTHAIRTDIAETTDVAKKAILHEVKTVVETIKQNGDTHTSTSDDASDVVSSK